MGGVFTSLEKDLNTATEEMENAPTADVASRARESMAEVIRISKISTHLKGGCKKSLNHSAVVAAASTEILRTRADAKESDSEALRQVKTLRRELQEVKREAQNAKEEAARLRKELAARDTMKRGSDKQRRVYVLDADEDEDNNPPTRSHAIERAGNETAEKTAETSTMEGDTLSVDDATETTWAGTQVLDGGDDERRKREICLLRRSTHRRFDHRSGVKLKSLKTAPWWDIGSGW